MRKRKSKKRILSDSDVDETSSKLPKKTATTTIDSATTSIATSSAAAAAKKTAKNKNDIDVADIATTSKNANQKNSTKKADTVLMETDMDTDSDAETDTETPCSLGKIQDNELTCLKNLIMRASSLDKLKDCIIHKLSEIQIRNAIIMGRNEAFDEVKQMLAQPTKAPQVTSSYSQIAQVYSRPTLPSSLPPMTPLPPPLPVNLKSVIISPKIASITNSKQTYNIVKTKLSPSVVKNNSLQIVNSKFISNNKIVLNCQTTKDCENICNILKNDNEIETRMVNQKMPKIMVIGVDRDIENNDIFSFINSPQNEEIVNLIKEDPSQNAKLVYSKNDRAETKFVIFEVTSKLFKLIMKLGYLSIGIRRCPVNERIAVKQCYKCQRFGHISTDCKRQAACATCAGHHESRACKAQQNKTKTCVNCSWANANLRNPKVATDHAASDRNCPQYQQMVAKARCSIQY